MIDIDIEAIEKRAMLDAIDVFITDPHHDDEAVR
jgi:hypothetical protein